MNITTPRHNPLLCPEPGCGFVAAKPQGLGTHRGKKHGYRKNGKPAWRVTIEELPLTTETPAVYWRRCARNHRAWQAWAAFAGDFQAFTKYRARAGDCFNRASEYDSPETP